MLVRFHLDVSHCELRYLVFFDRKNAYILKTAGLIVVQFDMAMYLSRFCKSNKIGRFDLDL